MSADYAETLATLRPALVRYARGRLRPFPYLDAEDIAQATLAAAWQARARLAGEPVARLVGWLRTTAKHQICDAIRAHRPHATIDALDTVADPSPGPERLAVLGDLTARALAAVPPGRAREIVRRRIGLDESAQRVGRALDMTTPAVRSALSRALAWPRRLVGDAS